MTVAVLGIARSSEGTHASPARTLSNLRTTYNYLNWLGCLRADGERLPQLWRSRLALPPRSPDVGGHLADLIQGTPPAGYIGCCRALPKIDVTDRLGEVRCPALVIVGEDDPGTPVEMARDIHRALPGAELAILRSASHLSNLEQPGEFTRVLAGFLDRVTGRSAL